MITRVLNLDVSGAMRLHGVDEPAATELAFLIVRRHGPIENLASLDDLFRELILNGFAPGPKTTLQ